VGPLVRRPDDVRVPYFVGGRHHLRLPRVGRRERRVRCRELEPRVMGVFVWLSTGLWQ
jgi:hypothetical protein